MECKYENHYYWNLLEEKENYAKERSHPTETNKKTKKIKSNIILTQKLRKMTGYEIFFNKKRESNPKTAVSDLRKESFAIWKKLNRAGKQFYEKLAQ
jgi:hypothetical protein